MAEEVKDENLAEDETKKIEKKDKKDAKEKKYKEEIARLERELKEEKEKNLREIAEMQTTKRRLKEEQINERKYAAMKLCGELINPLDMFIKIVNGPAPSEEIKNYQIGFQMIASQLLQALESEGLKQLKCEVNEEFNPEVMQVISSEEDDKYEKPIVLKVLQSGYQFKDRILRPTMVHVGLPKQEKTEEIKEEKGE